MPFTFKLSRRLARMRSRPFHFLAAAAALACEPGGESINGPDARRSHNTTRPGAVNDLAVTAVTDTSATLSFTEVNDGTGKPASYDVRFAVAPISWASAASVTRGSCATPLAPGKIGAPRSCTVLGLSPSTNYEFQLVAFRGSLGGNAVFGNLSNIAAAVTATAPSVTTPGAVTDLAVAGVTDTSVLLSFTEVNDGTGHPASYDVRYATGTMSWGAAASVARGTCATPVPGNAIGARRTCTVLGLAASSGYSFQLVAFRGTLDLNAVFGALSNVASGTTAGATVQPVASVTVTPLSGSVTAGGTLQFTATLKDAKGNVLSGRTVTWSSNDLAVATVSGGGLATGLVAGTAAITATSESHSGTAALAVTASPSGGGAWPHEPSGWTTLAEHSGDQLTPAGWGVVWNDYGYASTAADAGAPFSPVNVLQFMWPVGWTNEVGMGALYHGLPGGRRVFVGMWWKSSSPWQGHVSNVNKLQYLFTNGSGSIFMAMYGPPGGPYELRVFPQFSTSRDRWLVPNVNHVNVTLGQWHRVEWLVDYSGSSGRIQWWLDGVLLGDYADDPPPPEGFSEYKLHPVWGGAETIAKTETDYFWYDHVRVSGP